MIAILKIDKTADHHKRKAFIYPVSIVAIPYAVQKYTQRAVAQDWCSDPGKTDPSLYHL